MSEVAEPTAFASADPVPSPPSAAGFASKRPAATPARAKPHTTSAPAASPPVETNPLATPGTPKLR
jgi:hypothetical protein